MSPNRRKRIPRRIRHIPPERLANSFDRLPRPSPESPSLHSRNAVLDRPDNMPDSRSAQDFSTGDIPDSHAVDRLPRLGLAPSSLLLQRAVQSRSQLGLDLNGLESDDIQDHMRMPLPFARDPDDHRRAREIFNESTYDTHSSNTMILQDAHKELPTNLHPPPSPRPSVTLQECNASAPVSTHQHSSYNYNDHAAGNVIANQTFFPPFNQEGSWGTNQFSFTPLPTPVNSYDTSPHYQYQNDPHQQDGYPDPWVLFNDPPVNSISTVTDYYDL